MKLTKLEVKGFGRLKDLNLALGDGLNIIHGLNEAGKSTLQRFIQGMLYGLQKPMAQREAKLPELDRYRPWGGGDYRGALEYELKGGGRFRVERDFGGGPLATRIFDAATGKDLTKKFGQDRRHELRFAETHLGLGDGEFTSTCCLPQLGTDQIELAAQIGEKLANLAQAGQEDLSVQRAVKVLAEQVAKIGTDRAPTQPVALKRVEVQRLETLLQAARGQRQALLDEEVRLRSRETQVATLAGAASELEGRVLASRRVRLTTRLEQIRQGEAALAQAAATAERLKPDFDPPDPLVFESAGQSRLAELSQELRSLTAAREGLEREMGDLGKQLAEGGESGESGPAPDSRPGLGPDSRLDDLRRLQSALKAADEELTLARSRSGDDRLGALRTRLAALGAAARSAQQAGLAVAATAVILGLALGLTVTPALFFLAGLALPAIVLALSSRRSYTAQAAAVQAQLDQAGTEEASAAQRRRDLEAKRADILGRAGAESAADLDRIVVDLAKDLAQNRERRRLVGGALEAAGTKLERVKQEMAAAKAERQSLLARAGATTPEDFLVRAEGYKRYIKGMEERRRLDELLRQTLSGDRPEKLETSLAELTAGLPDGAAPFPEAVLEVKERDLKEVRDQLSAMEKDLSKEKGTLDGRYTELPDPADLDRRLQSARTELTALVETREVLTKAQEFITLASEQVAQRFAPALNAEVARQVARLTGGAYPEIRVDKGLAMGVIVDGTSHRVQDLSRGTLDQFYFALRLAVTNLLTEGREPAPFILDDSLVHYDDRRMAAALDVLAEVGRTNQVILFTCHRREVEAARAMEPGRARVTEL